MLVEVESLPAALRAIYEAVQRSKTGLSDQDMLHQTWNSYVPRARDEIPTIQIEDEGEIVFIGELSPGCQACKNGSWDCIFTTVQCNLNCAFCCNPHAIPPDYAGSAFGATPEAITDNYRKTRITGVSFSGGDPFVDKAKLFDWITRTTQRKPDAYYWVYTNGLLADEADFQRLAELGIDEIRFNMAATGYNNPRVMHNLQAAAQVIPNITVEIPAIPADQSRLLASLEDWCTCGVKFLNLHELMYEPGTNAATLNGPRQPAVTPDGHRTVFSPESRNLTLNVMKYVQARNLPLSVNDCSLQSKFRQLRGRRRSLAPLTQASYEMFVDDTFFESYCAYQGESCIFFHADALTDMHRQYPDYRFVRLGRTAPLSMDGYNQWCVFEHL